jgi:hypothetical protein
MLKIKHVLFITSSLLFINSAFAEQCNIDINYGVVITDDQIRILDQGKTYLQINGPQQLFVNGKEITLSKKQSNSINNFTIALRKEVPNIVSIAIKGIDISLKAGNQIIAGLTGQNSAAHQNFQKHLEEFQWNLRKRYNHSDDGFYLAPQNLKSFSDVFTGEFKQEIENILIESLAPSMSTINETSSNSDTIDNKQDLESLKNKIRKINENLVFDISSTIKTITSKTSVICLNIQALDEIENTINQEIVELNQFNLIEKN